MIKTPIDVIRAELLAMGIAKLGLKTDNAEDPKAELDPIKMSETFESILLLFKRLYFYKILFFNFKGFQNNFIIMFFRFMF